MKKLLLLLWLTAGTVQAQQQTEHIVLVTLDGLRWQELFQGADADILSQEKYVTDSSVTRRFWHPDPLVSRQRLMPFMWDVVARQGQLYGNRNFKNQVNCANPHWFSYPGYSELLTGYVDHRVHSNKAVDNPNPTVLEYLHRDPAFQDKVAVFSTWEVMANVVRQRTSGLYVNAGNQTPTGRVSEQEKLLGALQQLNPNPHGKRYDAYTLGFAWEYMRRCHPRVVMISLDETDEHGHGGRYDEYLKSIHHTDQMLADLWNWLQQDTVYKGKTTLLVTTDHGRGRGAKHAWKSHGRIIAGSGQIWCVVIGPDTPAQGEIQQPGQYYQKQIAATVAALLGIPYRPRPDAGAPLTSAISGSLLWESAVSPVAAHDD